MEQCFHRGSVTGNYDTRLKRILTGRIRNEGAISVTFRIYKGRKINRFLCLLFLILTLIFLIVAGIFALAKASEAGYTFCILAMITGGFSLLYGLFWFLYGRAERKADRRRQPLCRRQGRRVLL